MASKTPEDYFPASGTTQWYDEKATNPPNKNFVKVPQF